MRKSVQYKKKISCCISKYRHIRQFCTTVRYRIPKLYSFGILFKILNGRGSIEVMYKIFNITDRIQISFKIFFRHAQANPVCEPTVRRLRASIGPSNNTRERYLLRNDSALMLQTSSMKRTPGISSALPSSFHSATLALIFCRTSDLISPGSPEEIVRNACVRLLITSISSSVTVCTTSFLFWRSPSDH